MRDPVKLDTGTERDFNADQGRPKVGPSLGWIRLCPGIVENPRIDSQPNY